MEPVTLLSAAKLLGDLASKLAGKQKEMIEISKERLELANDQMETISRQSVTG